MLATIANSLPGSWMNIFSLLAERAMGLHDLRQKPLCMAHYVSCPDLLDGIGNRRIARSHERSLWEQWLTRSKIWHLTCDSRHWVWSNSPAWEKHLSLGMDCMQKGLARGSFQSLWLDNKPLFDLHYNNEWSVVMKQNKEPTFQELERRMKRDWRRKSSLPPGKLRDQQISVSEQNNSDAHQIVYQIYLWIVDFLSSCIDVIFSKRDITSDRTFSETQAADHLTSRFSICGSKVSKEQPWR
jgi:hypothetical protein